jgi:hypothetical protein
MRRETAIRPRGSTAGDSNPIAPTRSVEAELAALVGPCRFELALAHELDRAAFGGLSTLDDGLGDLRRQEAQSEVAQEK